MKKNRKAAYLRHKRFLCFLLLICFNFSSYANLQSRKVSLQRKSASVQEVIDELGKQVGIGFLYRGEELKKHRLKNINYQNEELDVILKEILHPIGKTYKVQKDLILIVPKKKEQTAPTQKKVSVHGKVVDKDGNPMPGVAVLIKGTNIGTSTDIHGNFTLKYIKAFPNPQLYVTMLGYRDVILPIKDKHEFTVTLKEEFADLKEVVVTGYTKQSKVRATSSATKITAENVERQVTTSLDSRMEGLATGLNINTVTPDGGQESIELILRGTSTFDYLPSGQENDPVIQQINSQNRQPLIVVDGFPYDGPFNDIDQATIESIDVLKDAAATALWGLRASNGVIVITTKRGKEGKPRISFSTNWTMGTRMNLNDLGLAGSADQIMIQNRAQELNKEASYAWGAVNYTDNNVPNYGEKYRHLNAYDEIWADFYAGSQTETDVATRDAALTELAKNDVLPEFEKYFTRPVFSSQNTFSINGGSRYVNYSFTSSYVDEKRALKGDDYNRLNLTLMTDIKLSEKLSTTFDVSVVSSRQKDNGLGISNLYYGNYYNISRFDKLVDENGTSLAIKDTYSANKEEFLGKGFEDVAYNPILEQKYYDNKSTTSNIRLSAGLNYKFSSWLNADFKYQYNIIDNEYRKLSSMKTAEMRTRMNNYILSLDSGDGSGANRAVPYGDWLELQKNQTKYTVARGNLNFNKIFADDHLVSGLIGMEATENESSGSLNRYIAYSDITGLYDRTFNQYQWVNNNNMIAEDIDGDGIKDEPYLGSQEFEGVGNYQVPVISRTIASFTNASYSYKAKYNIEGSLKLARGTAFGINKKLATNVYWAISSSWNAAKEDFLSNDWLNTLKLRASYGVNGNMRRGLTTQTVITYDSRSDWISGGQYAYVSNSGNPNLKPEQTNTINLGIDFSFFNRVQGTIDVYNKRSTDLLVPQVVNPTYALTPVFVNEGEIKNSGIEINLGGDFIRKDEFSWTANLNFTYNKNEVVKYSDRPLLSAMAYYTDVKNGRVKVLGKDISSQVRYRYAGLDANGDPQVYDKNGNTIASNSSEFLNLSEEDMKVTKPFIAPVFGSFTNRIKYKQFTLSTLMTYKFGHIFQEKLIAKYAYYSANDEVRAKHKDVAKIWRKAGDEKRTSLPGMPKSTEELSDSRRTAFIYSDYAIHNASHIRLKDITLQYEINQNSLSKFGIERANLLFQVRDLGLIWRANSVDIDPESVPFSGRDVSYTGNISRAFRPGIKMPVSFVVGAKIEF